MGYAHVETQAEDNSWHYQQQIFDRGQAWPGNVEVRDCSLSPLPHLEIAGYPPLGVPTPENVSPAQEFVGRDGKKYRVIFFGPLDDYSWEDQQRLQAGEKPVHIP